VVFEQALRHPNLRRVYQTQISPAALACTHGEESRTYTSAYGPHGMSQRDCWEWSPPAVLGTPAAPLLLRTYAPRVYVHAAGLSAYGNLVLLFGQPGVGKSTIAKATIAELVASGNHARRLTCTSPAKEILARLLALFCSDEFPSRDVARAATERSLITADINVREMPRPWAPATAPSVAALLRFVEADIISLDEVERSTSGKLVGDAECVIVDSPHNVSQYCKIVRAHGQPGARWAEMTAALVLSTSGDSAEITVARGGSGADDGAATGKATGDEHQRIPFDLVLWNAAETPPGATAANVLWGSLTR
jgi:hypothetical protein